GVKCLEPLLCFLLGCRLSKAPLDQVCGLVGRYLEKVAREARADRVGQRCSQAHPGGADTRRLLRRDVTLRPVGPDGGPGQLDPELGRELAPLLDTRRRAEELVTNLRRRRERRRVGGYEVLDEELQQPKPFWIEWKLHSEL